MDWDTGFLGDPKFLHLRDLITDPIEFGYAGFCYLRLAADTWRTGDRHSIATVVRGIPGAILTALQEADLLDTDTMIPKDTYEKWVGSAIKGRAAQAEKQSRYRNSPSLPITDGKSRAVPKSLGPVGPVGQVGTVGDDARDPDAFDAFYSRTGSVPGVKIKSWLNDLADRHGERALVEKIAATGLDNRQPPDYLRAVGDALALDDHRAEKAEKADELRRNEEKRRPITIAETPVEISEEEAKRQALAYMAEFPAMPRPRP